MTVCDFAVKILLLWRYYMKKLDPVHIDFLKELQKAGYKSAVIAGGAVRDCYFDRDPADIDVYIPDRRILKYSNIPSDLCFVTNEEPTQAMLDLCNAHTMVKYTTYNYCKSPLIECVWNVYVNKPTTPIPAPAFTGDFQLVESMPDHSADYQIVVTNIPVLEYINDYFDAGICICWHDGIKATYSPQFMHDANNKKITVCGKLTGPELERALKKHVAKLKSKFPNHTVDVDLTNFYNFLKERNLF